MFASLLECMVMASKVELDHLVWCTLAMMDLTHAIREERQVVHAYLMLLKFKKVNTFCGCSIKKAI